MDILAAMMNEESESEIVDTKAKKKKKLTSAALKKMQAKAAEEARQQLIKQKQEYLKEAKKRVQLEWDINHEKSQIYEDEFQERQQLFLNSSQKLKDVEDTWEEFNQERKKQAEWMEYLKCDRLPSSSSIPQMKSYIFVWTELEKNYQMAHCLKKAEEVMQLLKGLEDIMNDPRPNCPPNFVKDMKELRSEVRNLLQEHIDKATFYLFSRIETDMVPINITTSKYFAECQHFLMNLWAELITPIPSSRGKEKRNPLKVVLEEIEVTVIIPVSLLDIHKAVRAMWLSYDHWSDTCRTYDCPPLPSYFSQNLYNLFLSQQGRKVEIMKKREEIEAITKCKIAALPPEPSLSQEILAWDCEPQRCLSEEIVFREFEEEDALGWEVKTILNEFEVNLRERTFLGNLLRLEVLHQPPQAKYFRIKHSVTLRKEAPRLKLVDFYEKFSPPEEKPEVEGDEQVEKTKIDPKVKAREAEHIAEELKKLVLVHLKLCQSVIWFEKPQLANWDPNYGYWSTEDIHDVDFNEDEGTVTFRTGRLGLMGFHVSRYCNFPYEDWLFEASEESGVNFYLKTPIIALYFNIKEGKVCLERIENVPSKAMNWILGRYYSPAELMKLLKKGGIDVFPAPDASSYISEITTKHIVLERNIYQVWGLFSKSFRFKRSKFNQAAGRGNIVFQAQEVYKNHQVDYCLIQSAICSSYVLDINEESENYSPEKAPSMNTHIDLFSLLQHNCTGRARRFVDTTCYLLIQTVMEFLGFIRPISFS